MEEVGTLDNFCGSPFWDPNSTWHTDNPSLTPCFQNTVLVWFPCAFLWIFLPYEIHRAVKSTSRNIPWTWLNIAKCVVIAALICLESAEIIHSSQQQQSGYDVWPVSFATPLVLLCTFVLALFFVLLSKYRGLRTSGIQFIFWILMVILCIPEYRYHITVAVSEDLVEELSIFVMFMIFYPLVVCSFLLQCFADAEPAVTSHEKSANPCPEESASFLSQLCFFWLEKLVWKGYQHPLETKDLWDLNVRDTSKTIVPQFETKLQASLSKARGSTVPDANASFNTNGSAVDFAKVRQSRKQISILPIICRVFGPTFAFGSFLKLIQDLLTFVSPQILKLLIAFVEGDEEMWKGFMYAILLLVVSVIQTLFLAQYFHRMFLVGMNIRTALISSIYRKALKMSNVSRKESTVGEIVNLMSVDAQRLMDLTGYLNLLWSAPLQIALSLYFLWETLGPSVLSGLAVMILLIPINALVASKVKTLQMRQMKYKDERVKLMNEVLSGIKVLKLYAWEPSFQKQVSDIRNKEIVVLKQSAYLNAAVSFVWTCAPFLVAMASFGTYVLVDENNVLDAEKAFVSLTLFNIMRMPLTMLPMMIISVVQASVSLKRLNKFMNSEDLDPDSVTFDDKEKDTIVIENATFSWDPEDVPFLRNINVRVRDGDLVAVVGPVGSGKSSLLLAMLGEMEKISGKVSSKGSVAYVQQQAWIQNATLRDNILFGKNYLDTKYNKIVDACALSPDLEILPAGDSTEIGEKGINLSGGQKQRVSVARAVYNDAHIYLFDDPLSAVDSHVGKHIFDKVLGPEGILRKKTRVLVTHAITYLPQTDYIIVMQNGDVSETGTYEELLAKKGAFADFLLQHITETEEEEENEEIGEIMQHLEQTMGSEEFKRQVSRQRSRISESHSDTSSVDGFSRQASRTESTPEKSSKLRRSSSSLQTVKEQSTIQNTVQDKLIEAEKAETGSVKFSVYLYYLKAIGVLMVIFTMCLHIIYQLFTVGSNVWLSYWSNEPVINGTQDPSKRDMYLGVYGALGLGQAVTSLLGAIAINVGLLTAAQSHHDSMLVCVLRSPSSFFDTTPMGRIVNRFSKDVDTLDNIMPMVIRGWIYCFFGVVATIAVISASTPIFLSVIVPVGLLYYFVQRFYVATSRQLKRLESVSRSPIYSHFGETVTGAATIRAYNQQERFIAESEFKVDSNQMCYYPSIVANRWLAVRLETVGNMLIFFSALFAVMGKDTLNAGLVGLSVSYALQITQTLNWLVRMTCDVETNIVAVERIKEYSETDQEAPWEIPDQKPPPGWPNQGVVVFDNYETRYREGLDLVLKGISCKIAAQEKIGIVGRTGAGKSSLTLALFRLIEASGGRILIDDRDIKQMGLHDIRSRLTIIPQDPVLFSGTLRLNLDPFEQHTDEEIWKALELAHLKSFVKGLNNALAHLISEGGENLSVGQRQLVCLARALLRKTKVLVLDEATAAVDLETDDLIQKTIRSEFADCTVLTIAHRLNTIMDSTRVMVLDNGKIKEFDAPSNLLKDRLSVFYGMAKDAGLV